MGKMADTYERNARVLLSRGKTRKIATSPAKLRKDDPWAENWIVLIAEADRYKLHTLALAAMDMKEMNTYLCRSTLVPAGIKVEFSQEEKFSEILAANTTLLSMRSPERLRWRVINSTFH